LDKKPCKPLYNTGSYEAAKCHQPDTHEEPNGKAMNILITDSNGLSTIIGVGRLPRSSGSPPLTAASQINGWRTPNKVLRVLRRLTRGTGSTVADSSERPGHAFSVREGGCLFNTGSLFCFAGPRNASGTNVLMVLWQFPASLTGRRSIILRRVGRLLVTSAASTLAAGDITWDII